MKREDYISWDEYFMGVAKLAAMRSKDPNTQVGACIVSDNNKILSMGYNGFPNGVSDDEFPWDRDGDELETKLADLKKDLFFLRMQHATNQLDNPMRITAVKRDIARVLTVMREQELESVKNA